LSSDGDDADLVSKTTQEKQKNHSLKRVTL